MISEYDFTEPKRFIWPWQRHRIHLESEIAWLREQLAQKQRRIDEMQEKLLDLPRSVPRVQYERKPDGALKPVQPRGWEALRAFRKLHPETEDEQRVPIPAEADNAGVSQ